MYPVVERGTSDTTGQTIKNHSEPQPGTFLGRIQTKGTLKGFPGLSLAVGVYVRIFQTQLRFGRVVIVAAGGIIFEYGKLVLSLSVECVSKP